MRTLYVANKNYSSWSLRPWILLRVLGIPFEERLVPFGSGYGFSPTQRVPCLIEDGITVWDSLSIVEFIAESHAEVWPSDRAARAWARSACAEMHSGFTTLREVCGMNCGVRVELHEMPEALKTEIARLEALWADGIERFGGPWLAGEHFTAADAFFAPVVYRIQTYGLDVNRTTRAYVDRMLHLHEMREWYEAGLTETWRHEAHEKDISKYGRVLEDLRAV
ncbi:glutathione S-transferase family protein [Lysobacter sp. HDW10]|uniref:glutathione S-transferase family protein n=1 Tax=Lysobacter sp. HDW10 TaxID=2714936 RepID=UPI001408C28E|nr:glutathione S-transferase family protein [Lysobacter sp. HDW10]QIK81712.1 glutathione S-transferase family protein [Lysobacter sp. HDW10]